MVSLFINKKIIKKQLTEMTIKLKKYEKLWKKIKLRKIFSKYVYIEKTWRS